MKFVVELGGLGGGCGVGWWGGLFIFIFCVGSLIK